MPAEIWTIKIISGDPEGAKLKECRIERTTLNTKLFEPREDGGSMLDEVDKVDPDITFKTFSLTALPDTKFSVTIDSFNYPPPMGDEAHGTWEVIDSISPDNPPKGDWTAQAGGEIDAKRAAAADAP